MAKYDILNRKIEILKTLLFLQLLKFKKQKCAQNLDCPTKKWIFCNFYNFFGKFLNNNFHIIIYTAKTF